MVAYTGITQYGYEQGIKAQNDAVIKGYQKVAGQNLKTVTKISPEDINFGPDGVSAQGARFAGGSNCRCRWRVVKRSTSIRFALIITRTKCGPIRSIKESDLCSPERS